MSDTKFRENAIIYVILLSATAFFLYLHHLTQAEIMIEFGAMPVEILVTVFILDRFLRGREARARRLRLRHIKSYLFRSDLRHLFIANVNACARPNVSMAFIRSASLEDLKARRAEAARVEYASSAAMDAIIAEYVAAEPVWKQFLELAIANDFEDVFQTMVYILHFIADVRQFHENHPDGSFAEYARTRPHLQARLEKVLGDGIRAFLDYAIELKERQPELFAEVFGNYVEDAAA